MKRLRYKDYELAVRPSPLVAETQLHSQSASAPEERSIPVGLHEVGTVKEFGAVMRQRDVWSWWRRGMGYISDHEKP